MRLQAISISDNRLSYNLTSSLNYQSYHPASSFLVLDHRVLFVRYVEELISSTLLLNSIGIIPTMTSSVTLGTIAVASLSAIVYFSILGYRQRLKIAKLRQQGMVSEHSMDRLFDLHFPHRRECQNGIGSWVIC